MNNDDNKWPQFSSELMRQGPAIRKAYMASLVQIFKDFNEVGEINVLEVGSWAGASTITWAQAIQKAGTGGTVHCVDIWKPYFDLDVNQAPLYRAMNTAAETGDIFEQFKRNIFEAGVQDIVTYTIGDTKDVLPRLEAGHFKIVFIDASHKYEDVLFDVKEAQRLVADGGIICGDDLELLVSDVDQTAHISALGLGIDFILDPNTQVSYHPGVTQAISEVFQEISSRDGFWAIRRRGNSWETIDFSGMELIIPQHLGQFDAPTVVYTEFDFNIVKFRNDFVACRHTLGPINWDLGLEELQRLYVSYDFVVEQTLVDARLSIHLLEISRLNATLNKCHKYQTSGENERPLLIGEYKGYNLATFRGRYFALRQSIGFVDLLVDFQTLVDKKSFGDVLLSYDREGLIFVIEEFLHLDTVVQRLAETSDKPSPIKSRIRKLLRIFQ